MGEHNVSSASQTEFMRGFTSAVLRDLEALELMLDRGLFETGSCMMGAEQELSLVSEDLRSAPLGMEILEDLKDDPRFTTELARFNIEANLAPLPLRDGFLADLERELSDAVVTAQRAAQRHNTQILLTGILQTMRESDLTLENMAPKERYYELNRAICESRGGPYQLKIEGLDDLNMTLDSVMAEACNTSFQIHLQVDVADFARTYNLAQLISAPLLAAAVNSPLLMGHRLWQETRVALFEGAVDVRNEVRRARGVPKRVTFGDAWVKDSVLELLRDNVARFRVILTCEPGEDPRQMLERNELPKLAALCLHNGTVWRWNRPCYGLSNGVAHLRIENRILPAGPTVRDEVANAAFFYGMMLGLKDRYGDVSTQLPFDAARSNFLRAARSGLECHFRWLDGKHHAAGDLILNELLPAAREGLAGNGVPQEHIDAYLGTVEERVRQNRTGSRWALDSMKPLLDRSREQRLRALVAAQLREGPLGRPIHEWEPAKAAPPVTRVVRDLMSTDLYTVTPRDLLELATNVMRWEHIRHLPVEDADGRLVGLLAQSALIRALASGKAGLVVEDVMAADPPTIGPDVLLNEAIARILDTDTGALPVVEGAQLIGIVTERDLLRAKRDGELA